MGETKFTPGPWFAVNDGTKDEPMMMVKAARIAGRPPRHCVAIVATGDSPQEMENANATLIAAVHDLRDALQAIVDCYGVGTRDPVKRLANLGHYIDEARAALAKAEGR